MKSRVLASLGLVLAAWSLSGCAYVGVGLWLASPGGGKGHRALSNRQNPTSWVGGNALYWIEMDSNLYVNVLAYGRDCLTYIDTTVPIPIFPVWSVTVGNDPYGFAPSP
jgi:hypothetical protein